MEPRLTKTRRAGARPSLGEGTVLVVDDDRHLLEFIRRALKRSGMQVRVAHDIPKALAMLDGAGVDTVLLDLRLPVQGGLGALPKIRVFHPDVPVVVFTGAEHRAGIEDECRRLGAAGFVRKQADFEVLIGTLKGALRSRRRISPRGRKAP
jgi:DNA-binding NtrC family response regulator